jgi:transcriptional regulator with XRE-family HTH domain
VKDVDPRHAAVYERIGREIAAHRTNARLSQAELAALIGLTRTSISNIESGRQKMLVHTLIDIADSLRVPTSALIPAPGDLLPQHSFSGSEISVSERVQIGALLERMKAQGESEQ